MRPIKDKILDTQEIKVCLQTGVVFERNIKETMQIDYSLWLRGTPGRIIKEAIRLAIIANLSIREYHD